MFANCWIVMYQQHHHDIEMCFPIRVANVVAIGLDTDIVILVLHACISFERETPREREINRQIERLSTCTKNTRLKVTFTVTPLQNIPKKENEGFLGNFWIILSVTRFEPFGMFQTCWSFFR